MSEYLIKMHSGKLFDLGQPAVENIEYDDIAYALSHINRYTGHVGEYTVAQHSVIVASLLPAELQAYGLVHDFHEAYVGDISSPVKRLFRSFSGEEAFPYKRVVAEFDYAIHARFGLKWPLNETDAATVLHADLTALTTEMVQFFPANVRDEEYLGYLPKPRDFIIEHMSPREARSALDNEFKRLIRIQ